jgi:uncharacterized membrane protein YphA (DoxX/SURF4 family)
MRCLKWINSQAPAAVLIIRILVGSIFLSEGIQKFLFPEALGVGRFVKIGIPNPEFFAPFVGCVEIIGGSLILLGLLTRLVAIPLLINMFVAIYSTKLAVMHEFWKIAHEARTDYAMILSLLFLLVVGGGSISLDRLITNKERRDVQ